MKAVIILAGGKGERLNLGYNKLLYEIDNKPIYEYALDAFKGYKIYFVSNDIFPKGCSDMPDVLFLSWTVNKHPNDNPAGWQRIYDAGIRGFMTDNPIGLLKFIVNDLKTAGDK